MPFSIVLHVVLPAGKEGQRPGITREELRRGREAIVAGARLVIAFARATCLCYCATPGTCNKYRNCILVLVVRFNRRASTAAGGVRSSAQVYRRQNLPFFLEMRAWSIENGVRK